MEVTGRGAIDKFFKLSRLGNEFRVSAQLAIQAWAKGKYDLGIVALLVLNRCSADWIRHDAVARPERLTRAISIRAIARSLDAPYSTIRRHVIKLIELGVLVDLPSGVAVSNEPEQADAVIVFLIKAHDCFVRLIEDFAHDVRFAGPAMPRRRLTAELTGAALDIWLISFEVATKRETSWVGLSVWAMVFVPDVRHITIDPVLSERYANCAIPREERRPITARRIAKIFSLSYGKVYRHCQTLAAKGLIVYERGGWVMATSSLDEASVAATVEALVNYYTRRINELVGLGLDTGDAASYYIGERPALEPL